MSEQVAVGIDGTAASRIALEWTIRRAESEERPVVLLHVTRHSASAMTGNDSLVSTEMEYAHALSSRVEIAFEIHRGEPVKVLAEEAPRFTLLVVGTHKTGFLRGRAFGSTSIRLATEVTTPLAVIPSPSGTRRRGVLVGISDESRSTSVLRRAADEASRLGSPLTLIYAKVADEISPMSSALALVRNEYPYVEVRVREVVGIAGEVLTNASANAEVLFIGASMRRSGLSSVGYDVLLNISGPTIITPD